MSRLKLKWHFSLLLPILALASPCLSAETRTNGKKVVIFWSSTDENREVGAKTLENRIRSQSPDSVVILKDMADFSAGTPSDPLDDALRAFLHKNQLADSVDKSVLRSSRDPKYDSRKLRDYLRKESPDAVITTHLGSIPDLEKARKERALSPKKFAWAFPGSSEVPLDEITRYVFDDRRKEFMPFEENFGVENGIGIPDPAEALKKLDHDSPADVELILSEAIAEKDWIREYDANPFGHIAVRVGDDVYTAHPGAKVGENASMLFKVSFKDYLFGIKPIEPNLLHASQYGTSFGRHTLGLRIRGTTPEQTARMNDAIGKITEGWKNGTICYQRQKNNCADITTQIMDASGISSPYRKGKLLPTVPLDVFDDYIKMLRGDPRFGLELVWYSRTKGSRNPYKITHFPFGTNLARNLLTLLHQDSQRNAYPTTKALRSSTAREMILENQDGISVGDLHQKLAPVHARLDIEQKALRQLEGMPVKDLERLDTRKTEYFLDRVFFGMQPLKADLRNHLDAGDLKRIQRMMNEMDSAYLAYHETRDPVQAGKVHSKAIELKNAVDRLLQDERLKAESRSILERVGIWLTEMLRATSRLLRIPPPHSAAPLPDRLRMDEIDETIDRLLARPVVPPSGVDCHFRFKAFAKP